MRARRNLHLWTLALCTSVSLAAYAAPALKAGENHVAHSTPEVSRRVEQNQFNTERVLSHKSLSEAEIMNGATMGGTYESHFEEPFMRDVAALKREDKWVDMGAGRANALLQALKERPFQAIGAGYLHPDRTKLENDLKANPSFNYVEGNVFDHSLDKLGGRGNVSLITDLYGIAYYQRAHYPRILKLYGELLKPGGRVYMTHSFDEPNVGEVALVSKKGERVDPVSFWGNIKGFKVVRDHRDGVTGANHIVLERTAEEIHVPEVEYETVRTPNAYRLLEDVPTTRRAAE
jgi:hypothetical protein